MLRLGIILLANYFFCARYGLFYLALIPACSTADFAVGFGLMCFDNAHSRRALVAISLALNHEQNGAFPGPVVFAAFGAGLHWGALLALP